MDAHIETESTGIACASTTSVQSASQTICLQTLNATRERQSGVPETSSTAVRSIFDSTAKVECRMRLRSKRANECVWLSASSALLVVILRRMKRRKGECLRCAERLVLLHRGRIVRESSSREVAQAIEGAQEIAWVDGAAICFKRHAQAHSPEPHAVGWVGGDGRNGHREAGARPGGRKHVDSVGNGCDDRILRRLHLRQGLCERVDRLVDACKDARGASYREQEFFETMIPTATA